MVILGLNDRGEEMFFVSGYVPSSVGEKAFIDRVKVPNTQPSIFLCLIDIFPRTESNRGRWVVILNSSPPKSPDDGIDLLNKGLGKKNSGHVVHRDGRKDRFNIGQSPAWLSLFALTVVSLALNLLIINS